MRPVLTGDISREIDVLPQVGYCLCERCVSIQRTTAQAVYTHIIPLLRDIDI